MNKKKLKHFRKLNENLKSFKRTRIFSVVLFLFFAPLLAGSLVFINNHNSEGSETTFSEGQKDADSAGKVKTLMIVNKEK